MINQMPEHNNTLNLILGIAVTLLTFIMAYAYLKPHKMHTTRPLSTLVLKVSYLAYLFVMLVVLYMSVLVKGGAQAVFFGVEIFALFIVIIVPTIGIFVRKFNHFSKKRDGYNYFFTVVNIISIVALLLMFFI